MAAPALPNDAAARVEDAEPAALVGEKRKADEAPQTANKISASSSALKASASHNGNTSGGNNEYTVRPFTITPPTSRLGISRILPTFPRKFQQTTLSFVPSPERKPKDPAPPSSPASPAGNPADADSPPLLIRDKTVLLEHESTAPAKVETHTPLPPPVPPPAPPSPEPKLKWKGLDNYGNTCYVNVIMQALFFCPGFTRTLRNYVTGVSAMLNEEQERRIHRPFAHGAQLMGAMNTLFTCMDPDSPTTILAPLCGFLKEVRSLDKRFQGARQQDAQEFLNFLLFSLHATVIEYSKPPPHTSVRTRPLASLSDSDDENTQPDNDPKRARTEPDIAAPATATAPTPQLALIPDRSFISDMFEGKLELRIKCLECECASSKPEPFMDLSLSLLGNRAARSLEAILQDFFHTEKLTGRDKFFCDNCHAKTEARKGYVFASLPPILTLHLKLMVGTYDMQRFSYESQRKICTHLVPPLETNFSSYCRDAGPPMIYRLYAVVFHAGYFANSGHYRCIVRGEDGQWLLFDDEDVTALTEAEFMRLFPVDVESSSTAYILFYHRVMPGDNTTMRTSALSPSLAGIEQEVGSILTGLSAEATAPPPALSAPFVELQTPSPIAPLLPPDLIPAHPHATLAPENAPTAAAAPQQDAIMRDACDTISSDPAGAPPTPTPSAPTHDTNDMQM